MKRPLRSMAAAVVMVVLPGCGSDVAVEDDSAPAVPAAAAGSVQQDTTAPEAIPPDDGVLLTIDATMTATRVSLSRDTVPAGPVSIRVRNTAATPQAFRIDGTGLQFETPPVAPGAEVTLSLNLVRGSYRLIRAGEGVSLQQDAATAALQVR